MGPDETPQTNPQPEQTPPPAPSNQSAPVTPPAPPSTQAPPAVAQTTLQQPPATPVGSPLPSAFSLFGPSWQALKLNLGTFVVLAFAPIVLGLVGFFTSFHNLYHFSTHTTANSVTTDGAIGAGFWLVFLLFIVLSLIFGPALQYTQVKSVQNQKVSVGEAIKNGLHYLLRLLGLSIVTGFLIVVGFILLIVPGVMMLRRYFLASYLLIDQDVSISEAMKRSSALTKGHSMAVFGIIGVDILINIVSIIPIVGWIASFIGTIAYYNAPMVRYEQLKALGQQSTAVTPPNPAAPQA